MNLDQLGLMLTVLVAALLLQLLLMRTRLLGWADPLVFIIATSSFSFALGIIAVDDPWVMIRVCLYFMCFYVGLICATKPLPRRPQALALGRHSHHFRSVVLAFALIYFGLNAYVWARSGAILFSSDPSLQKAEAYAGGLGFIRRFNWSAGTFSLIASLYLWLWERSRLASLALAMSLLTALAGGAKGALLPVILALGLYLGHPYAARDGRNLASRVRLLLPSTLLIAAVPIGIVLMTERGNASDAFEAFIVRLFAFGDVLLYWGQSAVRTHFADLGFAAYVRDSLGSVLGLLRLIDYATPMGNQFIQFVLPAGVDFPDALGPNLSFYVRGELYLGAMWAPFHALGVGFVSGWVRQRFLDYSDGSLHRYTLLAFFVIMSASLAADESFVIGQMFDFLICGGFVYFLVFAMSGHAAEQPVSREAASTSLPR